MNSTEIRRSFLLPALLLLLCTATPTSTRAQDVEPQRSSSIITIAGEGFYVHTVAKGDTFYSLQRLYDVTERDIRANNPHVADGLKAGQVIKIPARRVEGQKPMSARKMRRTFDAHVVNKGETLYSIARRYEIPVSVLMEDNEGLDPAHISIGQTINIRKANQGDADPGEIEQELISYTDALNSVSPRFDHYVVKQGETLYSLSRLMEIPIDTITRYNADALKDGLKTGSILRLPAAPGVDTPLQPQTDIPDYTDGQPSGTTDYRPSRGFRDIDTSKPLNVVMMLPLRGENVSAGNNFVEFYQGALLALDELKLNGVSVNLDLFNTARSADEVRSTLETRELNKADIIIGPVYDDLFREVASFAAERGIIAVSPLAAVEGSASANVFQVAPAATRYDKLKGDLSPEKNVVVISTSNGDADFEREISPFLPPAAHRITYVSRTASLAAIERSFSKEMENVFVVPNSNENTIDEILATIASIHSNMVARGMSDPGIKVIGTSRWSRLRDKSLYFKLNVCYMASYHVDRGNPRVTDFDSRYVSAFSAVPSSLYPYAYRGYDVMKLFVANVRNHGSRFIYHLNNGEVTLLQVPYRFEQVSPEGKYENREWAKVSYKSNYTIEVE